MDRPAASAPELHPSTSGHVSPFQKRKTSSREEDVGEPIEQIKRAKLGGFEMVMPPEEGIAISNLQIPNEKKTENLGHQNEEEGTSQITEATALRLSEKLVPMPMDLHPLRADATVLNLNSPAEIASDDALKSCKGFYKTCLPPKHVIDEKSNKTDLAALGVDPNDPFYPYKRLGQVRSTAASECSSTTGPVEISESMRKWNEMKQNGFVSTIQVKEPITRLRRCQSRKKNDEELKKMINMTKQEQLNKHTSFSAPSQLLSGLNPGIIKHVRNSKQVNSIIKAMLRKEMLEKHEPHRPIGLFKRGSKEAINGSKEHVHASGDDHLDLSLNKPLSPCWRNKEQFSDPDMSKQKFNHESYNTSEFNSECDDDALTLKLSSSVTMAPEHFSKTTNSDFSINQEDITSLSVKAASVALQWLKLIQHDIFARLTALQRSKNRVKNAIEMELPYLFSRDLHPKEENDPSFGNSLTGCSQKETFNLHLTRWKALFTQMEVSLTEEQNQLEKWLRQVDELKSQCQEGLRYVNANGFLHLDSAKELRILKSQEAYEREFAVRAAAASIYSTCNMIMTTGNVPCF